MSDDEDFTPAVDDASDKDEYKTKTIEKGSDEDDEDFKKTMKSINEKKQFDSDEEGDEEKNKSKVKDDSESEEDEALKKGKSTVKNGTSKGRGKPKVGPKSVQKKESSRYVYKSDVTSSEEEDNKQSDDEDEFIPEGKATRGASRKSKRAPSPKKQVRPGRGAKNKMSSRRKNESDEDDGSESDPPVKSTREKTAATKSKAAKTSKKMISSDSEEEDTLKKNRRNTSGSPKGKSPTKVKGKDSDANSKDSDEEEEEEEGNYVVDQILDKKMKGKQIIYFLSWKGYDSSYNTWEPKTNLSCNELIKEFEDNLKSKSTRGKVPVVNSPAKSKYRPGPASKKRQIQSPSPPKAKKPKRDSSSEEESNYDSDNPPDLKKKQKKEEEKKEEGNDFPYTCLLCAKGFDVVKKKKKWTLDTKLAVDHSLNLYEGLNTFFTYYKGEYPLAKLEPIGSKGTEERQLCETCAKAVEQFCKCLQTLTFVVNKSSICCQIAGDLEVEKADWKGLLNEDDEGTEEPRPTRIVRAAEKVSYKESEGEEET